MKTRSRFGLVVAALSLLGTVFPAYALISFSDISASPNRAAIQYLAGKGVISGYADGTFKSWSTVNRAELLKILVGGTGATPSMSQYHNCFSDVTTQWFAPYVCYAKARGWVSGYGDGTFRPSNTVNTAEAIKMIVNSQGYPVPASASSSAYSDVNVNAWYAPFVQVAHDKNLLAVSNGRLGIGADMTRGASAESIYRGMSIKEQGVLRFGSQVSVSSSSSSWTSSSSMSSAGSSTSSSSSSSVSSSGNASSSSMSTTSSSSSSSSTTAGQAAVNLGVASSFAVLAGSTVTNIGQTTVVGNVGVSPGSDVVGFPPAVVTGGGAIHATDTMAAQAKLDLTAAYIDAAGRSTAPVSVSGNLGGMTLSPGLYKSTSSMEISSGDLTLDAKGDANAVFILQTASTLNVSSGRHIVLIGGAKASNVFWQVGTSANLESTVIFKGTIMADQSISLQTGATVDGRLLARIGAVTLQGNTVTVSSN